MFYFLLLIILLLLIYAIDSRVYAGIYSPGICFLAPVSLIAFVYDCLGPSLGFYPFNRVIYSEIFFAGCVYSMGGLVVTILSNRKISFFKEKEKTPQVEKNVYHFSKGLIALLSVVILLLFYRIYSLGGLEVLLDEDLQTAFASSGIFGHILVLAIFLLSYLLSFPFQKKWLKVIFSILLFICITFYQVKGWMVFPILIALFVNLNRGYKLKLSKLLGVFVLVFVIFILGYAFVMPMTEDSNRMFILRHFAKYCFAGVSGWSEALNNNFPIGQNPLYVLTPFSKIIGVESYPVANSYNFVVVNSNGEYTNVYTLIGNCLLYSGRTLAYCYLFLLGFLSYVFCYYKSKVNDNGILIGYSALCAALMMSFFSSYFSLLNVYELIFYSFIYCLLQKQKFVFWQSGINKQEERV